jgi:hypothetical protein
VPPFVAGAPCAVQEESGPEASERSDLKKLALSLNWSLPS